MRGAAPDPGPDNDMKKIALAALTLLAVLLAGCQNNGRSQNTTDLRALNAVADAEALDILVNDDVKLAGVAANTTTSYTNFSSGTQDVKARSATNQAVLLDKSLALGNGARNTLLLYGKRAAMNGSLLADDTTAPSSNHARVRLAHLSPDAGAVDLYITATDLTAGPALISAASYGAVTASAEVTAASYRIILTSAGTTDILFQSTATRSYASGASYTVVVMPSLGGKLVNAIFLEQGDGGGTFLPNPQARLRVVDAFTDGVLNVKVDGATALSNVPFTGVSSYLPLASGTRTVSIELANVPGTAIATQAVTLDPAKDVTFIATGTSAAPRIVTFADDNSLPASGVARVRFVNMLSDGSSTDAQVNFASQATGLAAGTASSYYSIAAGTSYTLTFASPGGITTLATISSAQLDAGNVYTVYLFGTSAGAQAKLVRDR